VFGSDEADEWEAILLGCPLLLHMWIHERFDIGRPRTDLSEYESPADGTDPVDLPTMGSLWCLRKVMTSLYLILRVMISVVPFTELFSFFAARLGWGAAEDGLQGLRWSDRPDGRCPGPVDTVRSCHGRYLRTTGALVPVLLRPGVLDDVATTGLRCLRRGVRCPPGDEAVRPLPGCASTPCATSASYRAQVCYHLTVLSIFRYEYSLANNFMFHFLC
jgi:hypothetical protein